MVVASCRPTATSRLSSFLLYSYASRLLTPMLAIAPPHVVFHSLFLAHIEHESLIAVDPAGSIASTKTAFCCGEQHATLLAKRDLKIAHVVVLLYLAAEGLALFWRRVELTLDIQDHQFFAIIVAQHLHERVIAIQQFAFRSSNKYPFLHLFKQETIFLFRHASVSGVPYDVNGSLLLAALLVVRRSRDHREAAKAGIGSLHKVSVPARAVWAALPIAVLPRENQLTIIADNIEGRRFQALQQRLVSLDNAEFRIVRQDDVLNRIKGIHPLPLGAQDLFQKS